MECQMKTFARCFLNSLLCSFRENYSTQHALIRFVENCRKALDSRNIAGAVFMDLSKAFDCLNHDLLIAKLEAYGFNKRALQLIYSYLNGQKQRVKVNGSFSTWRETSVGVPQGSVLGPLLFNIYLYDLFLFVNDSNICNYADDTTIYVCDRNNENVINRLENETQILSDWFQNNCMKLNGDKCHLMIFGEKGNDLSINNWKHSHHREHRGKITGLYFGQETFLQDTLPIVMQESRSEAARSFTYILLA